MPPSGNVGSVGGMRRSCSRSTRSPDAFAACVRLRGTHSPHTLTPRHRPEVRRGGAGAGPGSRSRTQSRAASAAKAAPASSAERKPEVWAAAEGPPPAVATATSTASPSTEPNCWLVLTSPEPRPASLGAASAVAATLVVTMTSGQGDAEDQAGCQDRRCEGSVGGQGERQPHHAREQEPDGAQRLLERSVVLVGNRRSRRSSG